MSEPNDSPLAPKRGRRRKVELSVRQSEALDGDLSGWSDEELRRGFRRDRNGGWSGRPPKVVPKRLHDELVKRVTDQAGRELRDNLVGAVRLYARVFQDNEAPLATRLAAADRIVDRVLGKAPVTVAASVTVQPWMEILDKIVMKDGADDIEDAELVDDRPYSALELGEARTPMADVERPGRDPITPPVALPSRTRQVSPSEFSDTPPAYDREGRRVAAEGRAGERWRR